MRDSRGESCIAGCDPGYNLQVGIGKDRLGFQSARFFAATHTSRWGDDPWFLGSSSTDGEHLTDAVDAPSERAAKKAWLLSMGTREGKIRRTPSRRVR